MTDKIKQTKLDTGLAQSKIAQTCTGKKSIKFTDYAIDRHLPSFIDKNNKTLELYNNGNHFRDFTYVEDVSKIILQIINRFSYNFNYRVLNVCRGKEISIKKVK